MLNCTFRLNEEPMSTFHCGSIDFSAFSGNGMHTNRRTSACVPNEGPIPPRTYYIFARQSGGLLGPLRDLFSDKDTWFALYAVDGKIDNETFCSKVKRGSLGLHPRGPLGISKGCTTLDSPVRNQFLRTPIKNKFNTKCPALAWKHMKKLW